MTRTTPRRRRFRRPPRSPPVPGQPSPTAGLLPSRRLAGYRHAGQHIAAPDRRGTSRGGLECLQAVPVAPPGDCRHGVRILVHRARLRAEAAAGRGGALLGLGAQSQHFIAPSRCLRNAVTWIRPACSVTENSLPPAPGAATCTTQVFARRRFQSQTPRPAAGCGSLIEFAQDVTRCLATEYASGPGHAWRCAALPRPGPPRLPRSVRARRCRMHAGRPPDSKCPHPVMPDHRSDGDSVTERGCRCHTTRTRSALCTAVSFRWRAAGRRTSAG